MNEPIILASGSTYRQSQLRSLGIEFTAHNSGIDETPQANESVQELVMRLATNKAAKIKGDYPRACVIGSDQVCALDETIYGKPLNRVNGIKQLQTFSGQCVEFFTALAVMTPDNRILAHTDKTVVQFRTLDETEIERYIDTEQPFDCAGSFKVESLGSSLFQAVHSSDPSALMGLPLIKLCEFLRQSGYQIP